MICELHCTLCCQAGTWNFSLGTMATAILQHGLVDGRGPGEWRCWPLGFRIGSRQLTSIKGAWKEPEENEMMLWKHKYT